MVPAVPGHPSLETLHGPTIRAWVLESLASIPYPMISETGVIRVDLSFPPVLDRTQSFDVPRHDITSGLPRHSARWLRAGHLVVAVLPREALSFGGTRCCEWFSDPRLHQEHLPHPESRILAP